MNILTDEEKIKQRIFSFLLEQKGYLQSDIIVDREFEVALDGELHKFSVDLLVELREKIFMIIRCARGSLISREREVLSCARIICPYQIPLAVATNGQDAEIIESDNGEIIGYGLDAIPSKPDGLKSLENLDFERLSEARIEKEKRIFLAFNTLKCPSECS